MKLLCCWGKHSVALWLCKGAGNEENIQGHFGYAKGRVRWAEAALHQWSKIMTMISLEGVFVRKFSVFPDKCLSWAECGGWGDGILDLRVEVDLRRNSVLREETPESWRPPGARGERPPVRGSFQWGMTDTYSHVWDLILSCPSNIFTPSANLLHKTI